MHAILQVRHRHECSIASLQLALFRDGPPGTPDGPSPSMGTSRKWRAGGPSPVCLIAGLLHARLPLFCKLQAIHVVPRLLLVLQVRLPGAVARVRIADAHGPFIRSTARGAHAANLAIYQRLAFRTPPIRVRARVDGVVRNPGSRALACTHAPPLTSRQSFPGPRPPGRKPPRTPRTCAARAFSSSPGSARPP